MGVRFIALEKYPHRLLVGMKAKLTPVKFCAPTGDRVLASKKRGGHTAAHSP
jgi:hypothetical protein